MPLLLVLALLWVLVFAAPMPSPDCHTCQHSSVVVTMCLLHTESWRGFAENLEEPTPKPFGQPWGDGASPPSASARHGHPQVGSFTCPLSSLVMCTLQLHDST